MSSELTKTNGTNPVSEIQQRRMILPDSVDDLKENIKIIHRAMSDVMKKDVHFGAVPGCGDKPVLLKSGAEKIMSLFHLGSDLVVDEITDGFDVRIRVKARGFVIDSEKTVGYGIGEASTGEKKFAWKEAVCDEQFDNTPETRRQITYSKDRAGNIHTKKMVRQNPTDMLNTVLKMAKKRALVDLCLTATACSDIFVQDVDDPDAAENLGLNAVPPPPQYQQPRKRETAAPATAPAADATGNLISEPQKKRLYAIGMSKGLSKDEMSFLTWNIAGVDRSDKITRDKYDEVVDAFEKSVPGNVLPREDGGAN